MLQRVSGLDASGSWWQASRPRRGWRVCYELGWLSSPERVKTAIGALSLVFLLADGMSERR
jgi:hypothetical protein